jgi:hypothetical protein
MAVRVEFRHVLAVRPGGRAHAVDERIAGRDMGEAVMRHGALQREVRPVRPLARGHGERALAMRQEEGLVVRNREQTLVRGGFAVLVLERVALPHVLGLQVVDEAREEEPEEPDATGSRDRSCRRS